MRFLAKEDWSAERRRGRPYESFGQILVDIRLQRFELKFGEVIDGAKGRLCTIFERDRVVEVTTMRGQGLSLGLGECF